MAKKRHEETLREALELLLGEILCVHWLDSGADHKVEKFSEIQEAELATQSSVGVLSKIDEESIMLVYNVDSYDGAEGIQIALNCVRDVDVYKRDTTDEE